jgi:hypothetical protein
LASSIKQVPITIILIIASLSAVSAQDSRAVGLYVESFTKYFLWPDEPKGELIIGVYGESVATPYLKKSLEGKKLKKVRSMPIKLKMLSSLNEFTTCSIVLVAEEKNDELMKISNLLTGSTTVLVTSVPGYNIGATVNIDANNNFNLEICSENIRATGIKISTALTSLAKEI